LQHNISSLELIILGLYIVFLAANFGNLQIDNIILFCLKQTCSLLWKKQTNWLIKVYWSCGVNLQILIPLVFSCRLTLGQSSQTWFSAFLGKYHLRWGLLDHMIKRPVSVGIRVRLRNQVISLISWVFISVFFLVSISSSSLHLCFGQNPKVSFSHIYFFFCVISCLFSLLFFFLK
jgi:hypothetical protein